MGLADGVNAYLHVSANPIRIKDPNGAEGKDVSDLNKAQDFSDLNPTVEDLNKDDAVKKKLTDSRAPLKPSAKPMSKKEARKYANNQAKNHRKAAGMNQGSTVQAGHTAAARHAPESGISKEDWDKQQMQELHSRKGKGLDATVTDQAGQKKVTSRHRAQEGLIDAAVERSKAASGGKLTPRGQLDAAAEVKWRTANVPMDQRDVDAIRKGGPARPEKGPPVDPKTGKVVTKEVKLATEVTEKLGKEATESTGKKLAKRAAKTAIGAAPGGSFALSCAIDGDCNTVSGFLYAVSGEIGIGPVDLQLVIDIVSSDALWAPFDIEATMKAYRGSVRLPSEDHNAR
jgi:hypothetical protein